VKRRAGLAAAGAVLVLAGAGYGIWRSPWLKLEAVQVTGNHQATAAEVVAAAGLQRGTRLTSISSAAVAARVRTLAWVEQATVTHVLPSHIRIAVRERSPAVVVSSARQRYLVDASGVVLGDRGSGYPVVTAIPLTSVLFPGDHVSEPGFAAAIAVLRDLPASLRPQLGEISAPSQDLVTVHLNGGMTITYGSAQDLQSKNDDVTALLAEGHYTSIDVRSPSHPAAVPS
jgi:cell division protein FtsQ